jgi:hypothetical protein
MRHISHQKTYMNKQISQSEVHISVRHIFQRDTYLSKTLISARYISQWDTYQWDTYLSKIHISVRYISQRDTSVISLKKIPQQDTYLTKSHISTKTDISAAKFDLEDKTAPLEYRLTDEPGLVSYCWVTDTTTWHFAVGDALERGIWRRRYKTCFSSSTTADQNKLERLYLFGWLSTAKTFLGCSHYGGNRSKLGLFKS